MDHLKFETPDLVSDNIEKIFQLFPSAITEMRGEGGGLGAAFFGQGGVGAAADAVFGVPDGFAVADDI